MTAGVEPIWLTSADVAVMLSLSRSTVYRLADTGQLRAVRVGGSVRFTRESVHAFAKAAA
ncbi:hypothetical protein GCM10009551_079790 [Nocardiopsis tropica]|uniref:helix-turn-helix domain-containing protein n=1 Tax=Tsukamurella strandjordii TaxID=147577 RepID=UPI00336EEBA6